MKNETSRYAEAKISFKRFVLNFLWQKKLAPKQTSPICKTPTEEREAPIVSMIKIKVIVGSSRILLIVKVKNKWRVR